MSLYWSGDGIELHLGDCLEVTDWLAADVLVTDPPYGVGWVSGTMSNALDPVSETIAGDESVDLRDYALALWGRRPAVVFGSWRQPRPHRTTNRLIWHKRGADPGKRHSAYYPAEEEIYLLGTGWVGSPRQNVIVTDARQSGAVGLAARTGHPTPKPVPVLELLIERCPPGVIADPFTGSGSTLIAARNQGRRAVGVEIHEPYAEMAARRLSQGVMDYAQ